jgi:methylenetetrahydrofolate dehydrogenase (NADP+)/methenyltetrahydrofolate cyclohydrolase
MAKILYGANVADAIREQIRREVKDLSEQGVTPTLAILRVGARGDDIAYENSATKCCESVGVNVRKVGIEQGAPESKLIAAIKEINSDAGVHGCLMFRPLPEGIDEQTVCGALLPEKDVDGITEASMSGVFASTHRGYPPCTAQACIEMLNHYDIEIAGKKAVVVGRSLVVGKPASLMLLERNATVTICHSRTTDLSEQCRSADILIVAAGKAGLIDASCINPDGVVIDVGINVDEEGRIQGDVRTDDAETARAYSPVPGGVGSVTSSVLAKHVVSAARAAITPAAG